MEFKLFQSLEFPRDARYPMTNLEQISIFIIRKSAYTAHDQEIYRQPYKSENTALSSKNLSVTILFQVGLPLFYQKTYPQPYHFGRSYPCFIEKRIRNRIISRGATPVLSKNLSVTVSFQEKLPLFC